MGHYWLKTSLATRSTARGHVGPLAAPRRRSLSRMNEIRVLVVCDWFLKYTAALALALQRKGAKVGLLCRSHFQEFDFNQDEYFAIISTLREADIDIFTVPGRVSSLRSNAALFRLHRELRKWKPQVAHAQDNHDPHFLML